MSKVLCLVLSFIIGTSAYQTLEARKGDAAMVTSRKIAQENFNDARELHPLNMHEGKKSKKNGSDSGQTSYNDLNLANTLSSRINSISNSRMQDDRAAGFLRKGMDDGLNKLNNNQQLADITEKVEIEEDKSNNGHLYAEHTLSMKTVDAWDDMFSALAKKQDENSVKGQEGYSTTDVAELTKNVMVSNDLTLINHAVNTMSSDTQDKIKKEKVKLTMTVTHLFPNKEKVTYEDLVNKHDQLRESYLAAHGVGDTEYANQLEQQMKELGTLAGKLITNVDGVTLDVEKMNANISAEETHAKEVLVSGTKRDWSQLTAKERLLLQSKHLQETFKEGLNTDDDERYAASKEILDRAVELKDYESLKLIRENTQASSGGTIFGENHPKKILKHPVKEKDGNILTVEEMEKKIEALQKEVAQERANGIFNSDKKEALDLCVESYAKALQEYAENNKNDGRWWTKIPESEFEAAEHQYNHIEIFRTENTRAAHYNNKTNANASGETSSNN